MNCEVFNEFCGRPFVQHVWIMMIWYYCAGEMADSVMGHCSTVRLCIDSSALDGGLHSVPVAWRQIHWISRILRLRSRIRFWQIISRSFRRLFSKSFICIMLSTAMQSRLC